MKTDTTKWWRCGKRAAVAEDKVVKPDLYEQEAKRIFAEIEPLITQDTNGTVKVSAAMALAGQMNIGVSLSKLDAPHT